MPRRSRRSSSKPPPRPPKDLKAVDLRLKGKPPPDMQESSPIPEDLERGTIKNWNLPKPNINTCVAPEHWPSNESDPKRWHIDIVRLLHEASTIDLKSKGAISCSNNEFFRAYLACEISRRQIRNKSRHGTVPWMTATDLKVVIKKLYDIAEDEEWKKTQKGDGEEKDDKQLEEKGHDNPKPNVRRGRSRANNGTALENKPDERDGTISTQQEKTKPATRGRGRPKKTEADEQAAIKPGAKRQASDLPIRPARKPRNIRSPKAKTAAPPPVTPANPPQKSDDEEYDQENEPPEPVSGRHIYGDFIKPTTVDFNAGAESEAPAQARTRQTRKRARAENDQPPTEVQIDSDPRDIDATGFLSELDPKEARRRRKPRLSRLQQDPVAEPAWSQDVPAPPETPLLTPATDGMVAGTPAAPLAAVDGVSSPPAQLVDKLEDPDAGIALLFGLLPEIPEHATGEERRMLEDRVALIRRDVVAFKDAVWEINARSKISEKS